MMLANDNEEPRAHLERAGGSADGTLGQPEGTGARTAEDTGDHHPPISSSSSSMGACDLDIMEGGGIGGEEKSEGGWGSAVVLPAAPDPSSRMHLGPVVDDSSCLSSTNSDSTSSGDLGISVVETGGQGGGGGGGGGGGRHASDDTPDANDSAGSAQVISSPTLVPAGDVEGNVAEETDWCKLLLISVGLLILFLAVAEGSPRLMHSVFPDSFSLSKLRKVCYGAAGTMSTVVVGGLVVRKYISSAAAQRLRECVGWIAPISALIL